MWPFNRKEKQRYEVGEFAHANKNLLVIVADPSDDSIFVAYKDQFVGGKIKGKEGEAVNIVKEMLSATTFERRVDSFLLGLADSMQLRRLNAGANNFLQFLDGAIFNIASRHIQKVTKLPQDMGGGEISTQPSVVDTGGRSSKLSQK